ncbi:MAG: DUF4347 domain-containing protein [Pseudomonadota bacterium]
MRIRHLALIDKSLPDLDSLCAALPSEIEIIYLEPAMDGYAQLQAALAGRNKLDALHLITHGAPGKVFVGTCTLGPSSRPMHPELLKAIKGALGEDGEWLIYGSDDGPLRRARSLDPATGRPIDVNQIYSPELTCPPRASARN